MKDGGVNHWGVDALLHFNEALEEIPNLWCQVNYTDPGMRTEVAASDPIWLNFSGP